MTGVANLSVFGPVVNGSDVEAAAIATFQDWYPTYLAELERRTGRAPQSLPIPRSYTTAAEFAQQDGAQLPAVIVVSPGTLDAPERFGDGSYAAWWRLEIAVLVTARDKASANDVAKLFAAATRMILLQQSTLGGLARAIEWAGDSYTDAPADFTSVGAVGGSAFDVLVNGVVTDLAGPKTPDLDPGDLGEVQTVTTTLERSTT